MTEPKLLILDESFAGLDAGLKELVAELIRSLQQRRGLACILIAHDLELVKGLASHLAVLEDGVIVEQGRTADVLVHPQHRLTRELIEASRMLETAVRAQ